MGKFLFWLVVIVCGIGALFHYGVFAVLLAFLTAFFAIGTVGFWVLVLLCVLTTWWIEAASWEEDYPAPWAVVPFVVFCLVVQFISRFNLIPWVKANWLWLGTRVGWYLLAGFVFFTLRWVIHTAQKRSDFDILEQEFRKTQKVVGTLEGPLDQAIDEVRYAFTVFLKEHGYNPDVCEITRRLTYDPATDGVWPSVGRNWRVVACWFFWWPFELVRWVAGDLWNTIVRAVREAFTDLFNQFSKLYFGKRSGYVVDKAKFDELKTKQRGF